MGGGKGNRGDSTGRDAGRQMFFLGGGVAEVAGAADFFWGEGGGREVKGVWGATGEKKRGRRSGAESVIKKKIIKNSSSTVRGGGTNERE